VELGRSKGENVNVVGYLKEKSKGGEEW